MPTIPDLPAIVLAVLVSAAAILDLRNRRIPNWLTVTGVLAGIGIGIWQGTPGTAALGMVLALAVYVPLFALRATGGGDVKLMAAVGALAGPAVWFRMFLVTAITGGVIALVFIAGKRITRNTFRNVAFILRELAHGRAPSALRPDLSVTSPDAVRLPHAVSIALGVLLYLLLVRKVH